MDLVRVDLNGFRRFLDTSINLDEKVIAIVGPNEAGKSSFLDALISLENFEEYGRYDISRGKNFPPTHQFVYALYRLDKEEMDLVLDYGGVGSPRWYNVYKRKDGNIEHFVEPQVERDKRYRDKAVNRLGKILTNRRLEKIINDDFEIGETSESSIIVNLWDILQNIKTFLQSGRETLEHSEIVEIKTAIKLLDARKNDVTKGYSKSLEITQLILEQSLEIEESEHPQDLLLDELSDHCPQILFFQNDYRNLSSEYNVSGLDEIPKALDNLLSLADVNFSNLRNAMIEDDHATRKTIEINANKRLDKKFKEWGQSKVSVNFSFEQEVIRIFVRSSDIFSPIAERSDGLRAFVALYAFTELKSKKENVILLIDEAESHLHYDAQADLIRVFENQDTVEKIIYTTHSAGCLPSDLGTGIRVISPIFDDEGNDTFQSVISNSFWKEGAGYSPLMLAMGASVMALVPTRRALIAEGAADMILLPSMIRQATGNDNLDFQVAPGLASVSGEKIQELELEAPKVAYYIDGDDGGNKHRKKLLSADIPEEYIIQLQNGFDLEDCLEINLLVKAINDELHRSHGDEYQIDKEVLGTKLRFHNLATWCKERKINTPSKRNVASYIAAKHRELRIIDNDRIHELKILYEDVCNVMNL